MVARLLPASGRSIPSEPVGLAFGHDDVSRYPTGASG
jgi:hypothetical protein